MSPARDLRACEIPFITAVKNGEDMTIIALNDFGEIIERAVLIGRDNSASSLTVRSTRRQFSDASHSIDHSAHEIIHAALNRSFQFFALVGSQDGADLAIELETFNCPNRASTVATFADAVKRMPRSHRLTGSLLQSLLPRATREQTGEFSLSAFNTDLI